MVKFGEVTPLAGVWIEIKSGRGPIILSCRSHPSRVCGLKYGGTREPGRLPASHPSRVCGLK